MGKLVILSVTDHEEHIINKIMELIADEPEFIHLAPSPPQSALSPQMLSWWCRSQSGISYCIFLMKQCINGNIIKF